MAVNKLYLSCVIRKLLFCVLSKLHGSLLVQSITYHHPSWAHTHTHTHAADAISSVCYCWNFTVRIIKLTVTKFYLSFTYRNDKFRLKFTKCAVPRYTRPHHFPNLFQLSSKTLHNTVCAHPSKCLSHCTLSISFFELAFSFSFSHFLQRCRGHRMCH